jgi:dihydroorotase
VALTDGLLKDYDTNFKMNPPLRSQDHVEALLEGVADGTITVLASDHAPHCGFEKEVEFDHAPFGILGLETELGLFIDLLVHKRKVIGMKRLIEMYTVEPAKLLGLSAGTLSVGAPGDVTVIDPGMEWMVDAGASFSRSRNTPFHGWELKGRAVRTVVDGETVWSL